MDPDRSTFARGREIAALLLWSGAAFTACALGSYQVERQPGEEGALPGLVSVGANWMGSIGEWFAESLGGLVGVCAWAVPLELLLLGIPFVRARKSLLTPQRLAGDFLVLLMGAALVQVAWPEATVFGHAHAAGSVGELFGEIMRSLFSTAGSFLVSTASLGLLLIGRASFSFITLMRKIGRLFEQAWALLLRAGAGVAAVWNKARELDLGRGKSTDAHEGAPHICEDEGDRAQTWTGPSSDEPPPSSARREADAVSEVAPWSSQLQELERVERAVAPSPSPEKSKRARKSKAPAVAPASREPQRSVAPPSALESFAASVEEPFESSSDAAFDAFGQANTPTAFRVAPPTSAGSVKRGRARPVRVEAPAFTPTPQSPVAVRAPEPVAQATRSAAAGKGRQPVQSAPVASAAAAASPDTLEAAQLVGSLAQWAAPEQDDELDTPAPAALSDARRAPSNGAARSAVSSEPVLPSVEPVQPSVAASRRAAARKDAAPAPAPQIVDTSAAFKKEDAVRSVPVKPAPRKSQFALPSLDFLSPGKVEPSSMVDRAQLLANADRLVKTLGDYGVSGVVDAISPGPTVTTYEVSPAPGTKVSKVAGLADDLALALARKVRIVAPIPGKNRIGFELPNERRAAVNLRDLVEDARFQQLDVPLPVVLGRDIVGNPVYTDLASMPHVIVAGATGAGKSVGLNVMLTSLLYRRSPEELRMLMIDPKVVELAPFDRIPHMLLPVVTDMKQAANALKWAVDEMERRYQAFADAGTKNITTYNAWVGKVERGEVKNPNGKKVKTVDHNGFVELVDPAKTVGLAEEGDLYRDGFPDPNQGEAPLPEKMPFIVIVVDEFADLMMQQGKEVEAAVARLAQKARAAGMHVILATQRPSVDVITGMIKANFPTRVAFRVAQKVDSRTILDEQGAEHLLGKGDMLIRLNGTNDTRRVQCPWVSEEEVQAVTDHLRAQGEPVYDENILKPRDEEGGRDDDEEEPQDALYDDAVRIVAETRRCSTSWLQRKLGLGYNRAARIVEMMERRGLVGPANGSKDREVLIDGF